MPIEMTPLAQAAPGPVTSLDVNIISPNEAYSRMNCPVVMKSRTLIVDRGQEAELRWNIRDRNGDNIDLTDLDGYVQVRLQDALDCGTMVYLIDAAIETATLGLVTFELPADVRDRPSIYNIEFGVYDATDKLLFVDRGLLSVERGLFFVTGQATQGPITLQEVRLQMRDTLVENMLLGQVEFDNAEILHSIVQPVMYWNEIPPPIGYFTPHTFPFRYHWLRATCANLLKIAAAWYLRNKQQIAHGGMQEDILNRNNEYLVLAQLYEREWLEFVEGKKVEINIRLGYGSMA